jgi:hypothetical protein
MQVREISKQEVHVINDDGSIIAGINIGYYRPWIYPLCTTSGINVLREFPPDHGFHNGAFFGHYPLMYEEVGHNFWGAPPHRSPNDELSINVGRVSVTETLWESSARSAIVSLVCFWIDHEERVLLLEKRNYDFQLDDASLTARITSNLKNLSNKSIKLLNSKYSGHAFRLATMFTEKNGAQIYMNNQLSSASMAHGMSTRRNLLSVRVANEDISFEGTGDSYFFIRNYGLISINPFLRADKILNANRFFTFSSALKISTLKS